jgi:ABC-type polysaccharide/polyol phosphate export permease
LGASKSRLVDALHDVPKGWRDVLRRHRSSRMKPLWISIVIGFLTGGMGTLYSAVMKRSLHDPVPDLVAGFMTWNFSAAFVNLYSGASFPRDQRILLFQSRSR